MSSAEVRQNWRNALQLGLLRACFPQRLPRHATHFVSGRSARRGFISECDSSRRCGLTKFAAFPAQLRAPVMSSTRDALDRRDLRVAAGSRLSEPRVEEVVSARLEFAHSCHNMWDSLQETAESMNPAGGTKAVRVRDYQCEGRLARLAAGVSLAAAMLFLAACAAKNPSANQPPAAVAVKTSRRAERLHSGHDRVSRDAQIATFDDYQSASRRPDHEDLREVGRSRARR